MLRAGAVLGLVVAASAAGSAGASAKSAPTSFLHGLTEVTTLASTIPANGDENPYAVYVAPYSIGSIHAGDVLVDDYNSVSNEQGTGTSVLRISPSGKVRTFATIPRHLATCPGGIGLTTALTEFRDGWVLVGSAPTKTGTTATAGRGCLVVLSATGRVAGTITGPEIDGPWDMAAIDHGSTAVLLLSNTFIGVGASGQHTLREGNIVRLTLSMSTTTPPSVQSSTVIAHGLSERPNYESRVVVGPTGIAIKSGTAYVSDPLDNAIVEIPNALTRTTPAGTGKILSSGGALRGPLAMTVAPNGNLLVTNGLNGDVVEITTGGRQVAHVAVDPDPAQDPPGNGDLFGIGVMASGKGIYFAKDDTNTLAMLTGVAR